MTEILIFVTNFDFCYKFWFFTNILMFYRNFIFDKQKNSLKLPKIFRWWNKKLAQKESEFRHKRRPKISLRMNETRPHVATKKPTNQNYITEKKSYIWFKDYIKITYLITYYQHSCCFFQQKKKFPYYIPRGKL